MESRKMKTNLTSCSPSPLPNPSSTSVFKDLLNFKTPNQASRTLSFQSSPYSQQPKFFTASKNTPVSHSRRGLKTSSLKSKMAQRLKAFELEQYKSARKSGKVYIQRCNSSNSSSSTSENKQQKVKSVAKFQDLNFPPASNEPLNLFDDAGLGLKLVPSTTSSPSSSNYQSVCTLDKVKSALERAEKEQFRKRSISMSKSSTPPSNSSSSVKDSDIDHEEKSSCSLAAGCPSCLIYVLISKSNPKCPRCNGVVPSPVAVKKPRIDLNISI
ncbi:unnamed protein product [Fraxinus pennsylvanica]|uniref:GIR1-like zinc ribbon domain-containing protein n=1 Tax=Fraxinus pennsylvanica TaxID=56036 RepID=A0AAD1ZTD3_9LAMI|nr:unnamed protein product [Fraxinus pennsylvanica]